MVERRKDQWIILLIISLMIGTVSWSYYELRSLQNYGVENRSRVAEKMGREDVNNMVKAINSEADKRVQELIAAGDKRMENVMTISNLRIADLQKELTATKELMDKQLTARLDRLESKLESFMLRMTKSQISEPQSKGYGY